MKKLFISVLMFFGLSCTVLAICVDIPAIMLIENGGKSEYIALDKVLAQKIKEMVKKINRAHEVIEKDATQIMQNSLILNEHYLLLEKEILHNEEIINKLNSVLLDMVGESANVKSGKKSLNSVKRELLK